jgi:hypothetical protein
MPANTFATPAPRRPAASREYGDDGLFQRLARRLRDLLIMGVAGPITGALAIVALHFALGVHPSEADIAAEVARQREAERALAILEDRWPGTARANIPQSASPTTAPPAGLPELTAADFRDVQPTPDARHMADWVVARHDNGRMPFMVLDKRDARLYVFKPNGELVADTPVLLGAAHGDDTYPGIGDVPISQVKPYQRTTAAGRFVTRPGLDADHTDVVWLDYDAALAMHRVINKVKSEHRLQRLASPNPKVRRISWGCINIPIPFFDTYISPVFGKRSGVTYVIPERKTFAEVFERTPAGAQPMVASTETLAPKDVAQR